MQKIQPGALLGTLLIFAVLAFLPKQGTSGQAALPAASGGTIPFIQNQGQFDSRFLFQSLGGDYLAGLSADSIWLSLPALPSETDLGIQGKPAPIGRETFIQAPTERILIRLSFAGANPHSRLLPLNQVPGKFSFFQGQDAARWVTAAPGWGGVRYLDLYPGVDLEIAAFPDGLAFNWVAPDAPDELRLELTLSGGSLVVADQRAQAGVESFQILTPWGTSFLPVSGSNLPLRISGMDDRGRSITTNLSATPVQAGTRAASSDRTTTASVELSYGTYLGGALWDEANGVASDPAGNLYLAGQTLSPVFPTGPGELTPLHNVDAFVARIDASTGQLGYLALFQGADLQNGEEWAMSLAADALGNAFVAGRTNSPAFPVTPNVYDPSYNGDWDVFALKLSFTGELLYSTFIGGGQLDWGTDLAIDPTGSAYITGGTFSDDFPTSAGAYNATLSGARDIFLARLNPDGTALEYGTFIGGTGQEQGESLALASSGMVYLTGWTNSTDFPTTAGVIGEQSGGGFDVFVVKLAIDSPALHYATYLGGMGEDRARGVAVEPGSDEVIINGRTNSDDFPVTPGALSNALGGGTCDFSTCPDAFVARLDPTGESLIYATFLGGTGWDEARGLAIGSDGELLIAGETQAVDFPVTSDGFDLDLGGDRDGFFTILAPGAYTLLHSSFLGGENWDSANDVTAGGPGQIILAGKTLSTDFPTSADAYAGESSGDYDAFAVSLTLHPSTSLYLPLLRRSYPIGISTIVERIGSPALPAVLLGVTKTTNPPVGDLRSNQME